MWRNWERSEEKQTVESGGIQRWRVSRLKFHPYSWSFHSLELGDWWWFNPIKSAWKNPAPHPKVLSKKRMISSWWALWMDICHKVKKKHTKNSFFIRSQWIRHHMDSQNHYRVYTQHCIFWSNKMLWNYWNMVFNDKQLESTTFV